jgi:chromosome segregation ATPase
MTAPFRDATAALERLAVVEEENRSLRAELDELARLRIDAEELAKLRAEVIALRGAARGENEGAYLRRLGDERNELQNEVRDLRARIGTQERELANLRFQLKRTAGLDGVGSFFERLLGRDRSR